MANNKIDKRLELLRSNIKKYRIAKNYTQDKLSELSGISQDYLSEIERGKCTPSIKRLMMIADGLELSVKDLFDFD